MHLSISCICRSLRTCPGTHFSSVTIFHDMNEAAVMFCSISAGRRRSIGLIVISGAVSRVDIMPGQTKGGWVMVLKPEGNYANK